MEKGEEGVREAPGLLLGSMAAPFTENENN